MIEPSLARCAGAAEVVVGQDYVVARAGEPTALGWRRFVLAVVAAVLALSLLSSLAWPHVVPRLAVLPKPSVETWYDGCNWHGRQYERSSAFWAYVEDQTTRDCPPGGLPEDDR